MAPPRENDAWLRDLAAPGEARERALGDLGVLLLRALKASFAGKSQLGEDLLQDLVQDSLLRIIEKLETFNGRSQFTTWATRVAVNGALTELRRKRWRDVSLDSLHERLNREAVNTKTPEVENPARALERQSVLAALKDAITQALTDRQREAIAAELQGMPLPEIARRTGSSLNAVYKLTHDARKRLRQHLESQGHTPEAIAEAFG